MSATVDGVQRPAAAAAGPAPRIHEDSDGDVELDSLDGRGERRRGGMNDRRGQRNRRRQQSAGSSSSVLRVLSDCFALNKVVCSVCLALVLLLVTVANLALEAVSVSNSSRGNQTTDGGSGGLRVAFQKVMAVVEEGLRKQLPVYIASATGTDLRGSDDGGDSEGNNTSQEQGDS